MTVTQQEENMKMEYNHRLFLKQIKCAVLLSCELHVLKNLQSFPVAVDERLTEGLILWNGLKDGLLLRHVADGPLAQPRTAQTEDIAVEMYEKREKIKWKVV